MHYIVREGFLNPGTAEILPEKPAIEITVSYCEFTDMWEAADTAGEWNLNRSGFAGGSNP